MTELCVMFQYFKLIALIILGIVLPIVAGHSQTLKGSWQNELGSIVLIDSIAPNGSLFGKYQSSSGVDGRIFPLQGWVNRIQQGNVDNERTDQEQSIAVSFTVRWDGYGSITSWTGYYDIDEYGGFIKTLWHLVRPTEKEQWERIITNSSTFRPI